MAVRSSKWRCPDDVCGWESTLRPTTWPCCPNCLVYEDARKRVLAPDTDRTLDGADDTPTGAGGER